MVVVTLNSRYEIGVLGGGMYEVSGGWFDRNDESPSTVRIAGSTWGGSIINVEVLAACGLCIEFGNRLITSSVQKIFVLRRIAGN